MRWGWERPSSAARLRQAGARPAIHFLTFGSERFEGAADALVASAERLGFFASATAVRFADIAERTFVRRRAWLRPSVPGCGFWAWKPLIIRDALARLPAGDIVVYWDAGRARGNRFIVAPRRIVATVLRSGRPCPGVLIPQYGANRRWTHRACFEAVGVTDEAAFTAPQIQATFSVWPNHPGSRAFLDEWLELCGDLAVVGDADAPQPEGFVGHRHDQSVCTLLARKHACPPLHLTNPAIVQVMYRWRLMMIGDKEMNFVELALRDPSGLAAVAYQTGRTCRRRLGVRLRAIGGALTRDGPAA